LLFFLLDDKQSSFRAVWGIGTVAPDYSSKKKKKDKNKIEKLNFSYLIEQPKFQLLLVIFQGGQDTLVYGWSFIISVVASFNMIC